MVLVAGKMFRPIDAVMALNDGAYVTEELNHRISKWLFNAPFFEFTLANGNVTGLANQNLGTKYDFVTVSFSGGGGSGAQAFGIVVGGVVTELILTLTGSGFTSAPTITVVGAPGGGFQGETFLSGSVVTSLRIIDGGTGFPDSPTVVVDPPNNPDPNVLQVVAKVFPLGTGLDTALTGFTISNRGSGYTGSTIPMTVSASPGAGTDAEISGTISGPWGNNGDGTTGQPGPIVGPLDNNLDHPCGIAFDGTRFYVADSHHNRIRTFSQATGQFLGSAGIAGTTGANTFNRPSGLTLKQSAPITIIVADQFNHRVIRYEPGDTPSNPVVMDSPEAPNVPYNIPHGASHNRINAEFLIGDSRTGILTAYADTSTFGITGQRGQPSATPGDNNLFFPGSGTSHFLITDIVIANTKANSGKEIEPASLKNVGGLDQAGLKNGQLANPESMSQHSNFVIYLLAANTRSNRVEVFEFIDNEFAEFRSNFGSPTPIPA